MICSLIDVVVQKPLNQPGKLGGEMASSVPPQFTPVWTIGQGTSRGQWVIRVPARVLLLVDLAFLWHITFAAANADARERAGTTWEPTSARNAFLR